MVHLELMKIATFNIRYSPFKPSSYAANDQVLFAGDGEAPWSGRLPFITDQIKWESPDIIGFQEVLEHQYHDLKAVLSDFTSIGVGRDDGITRGEYVPLFWRTDKFKALSVNHFWLSERPDDAGTIGWDAGQTRMVTLVHLQPMLLGVSRSEESNASFFVMNTHFDDRGLKARTESAKLILKKSNELITETGRPIVLMGDFNAPRQEAAYKVLTGQYYADETPLQPADQSSKYCAAGVEQTYGRDQAPHTEPAQQYLGGSIPSCDVSAGPIARYFIDCGAQVQRPYGAFHATFTGFDNNPNVAQVIDFVMIMSSPSNLWQVIKYGVISNQFQDEPLASDHRMVCAVIQAG
ncbi:hypothetical protein PtA15_2A919 [Puccinia triticina]|uniref:Endonuclease/exonuclease/phosphatase domain-containing protein n=1 Tax=Puccinia triticina TaxID=208348 RepID=A0ABY7CIH4_9BASI|nr:uncharacterized protein PtA15_2A919 [Puccinia triticina]WAQ82602.1 hypothetical protein PtA15_2A919 [Puccinia triticina]